MPKFLIDHPKRTSFLFLLRSRFCECKISDENLISLNRNARWYQLFAEDFFLRIYSFFFVHEGRNIITLLNLYDIEVHYSNTYITEA